MELFELMRTRRSIRRYQGRPVPRELLERVLEAGSWAPNAGGGQRTMLVGIRDRELLEKLGRLNAGAMDRAKLVGGHVSADQPSLIDDPSLKSGFYGAPAVCAVFAPRWFLYGAPDAFCCAENMALAALELGLSSCIVARGQETFSGELGAALKQEWGIPEDWEAQCFVLLGCCAGDYPPPKPRKAGRTMIVEQNR